MGWIYIVKYKSRDHLYIWIYYRWEHSEFPNIWICNLTSRVMYDLYVSKFTEVNLMLQIFIIAIHSNSAGGCWHVRNRTGKIKLFYLYRDQDCCRAILRHKCTEIYPHIRYMWWNMIFTMVWLGLIPSVRDSVTECLTEEPINGHWCAPTYVWLNCDVQ